MLSVSSSSFTIPSSSKHSLILTTYYSHIGILTSTHHTYLHSLSYPLHSLLTIIYLSFDIPLACFYIFTLLYPLLFFLLSGINVYTLFQLVYWLVIFFSFLFTVNDTYLTLYTQLNSTFLIFTLTFSFICHSLTIYFTLYSYFLYILLAHSQVFTLLYLFLFYLTSMSVLYSNLFDYSLLGILNSTIKSILYHTVLLILLSLLVYNLLHRLNSIINCSSNILSSILYLLLSTTYFMCSTILVRFLAQLHVLSFISLLFTQSLAILISLLAWTAQATIDKSTLPVPYYFPEFWLFFRDFLRVFWEFIVKLRKKFQIKGVTCHQKMSHLPKKDQFPN